MDAIISEIGDPSLASAFNSRYNGPLAQHQGIIYDSNSIQQAGSPVPQVYASSCKPETGYWHQASEYNVNAVRKTHNFSTVHWRRDSIFNNAKLAFAIPGSIQPGDCARRRQWLCRKWWTMDPIWLVWSTIDNGTNRMCELLDFTVYLLETNRWAPGLPSVLIFEECQTENG